LIILNKGFFILYFVVIIFSLLLALFFVYSNNDYKEKELIEEFTIYSNSITDQTVLENNISYFIRKNIETELYITQDRGAIKLALDPIIKNYLVSNGFDISLLATDLFIEIIPLDDVLQVNYQYVFITTTKNTGKKVIISSGAIYGGSIIV